MLANIYSNEWSVFKRYYSKLFFIVMGLSFFIAASGYWWLIQNPEQTEKAMQDLMTMFQQLGVSPDISALEMFKIILMQNLRAALLTVALGLIPLVVLPLLSPVVTSGTVSALSAFMHINNEPVLNTLLFGIAPHGIIELPALFFFFFFFF
ncbi:putative membrane protein SpoIIM required for sporulation [Desulfitispora alkaliphila]|uniref:stage II sporulation protein M n=1 Tax=Desulfitispora alkaliphila TaxID=622674 RepID=UPI003D1FF2A4